MQFHAHAVHVEHNMKKSNIAAEHPQVHNNWCCFLQLKVILLLDSFLVSKALWVVGVCF